MHPDLKEKRATKRGEGIQFQTLNTAARPISLDKKGALKRQICIFKILPIEI